MSNINGFAPETPTFKGETPTFKGETPTFKGETPTFKGECPQFDFPLATILRWLRGSYVIIHIFQYVTLELPHLREGIALTPTFYVVMVGVFVYGWLVEAVVVN